MLVVLSCVILAEMAWTIYLGAQLPRTYIAEHWDVAWVGLDLAEIAMLAGTAWAAWAAWKRRAILVGFAVAAATLLVVDGWFDLTTARSGDFRQSLVVALLVELPGAIAMLWIAQRGVRRVVHDVVNLEATSLLKLPLHPPER
ncbi:MAG: hypothetical protein B7X07_05625 [Actinobacteria bacterium 21-64-8]|nr:MAG: hypothetical protein B7X07_05625 [Actinobacteria bacterium 21-64-8]